MTLFELVYRAHWDAACPDKVPRSKDKGRWRWFFLQCSGKQSLNEPWTDCPSSVHSRPSFWENIFSCLSAQRNVHSWLGLRVKVHSRWVCTPVSIPDIVSSREILLTCTGGGNTWDKEKHKHSSAWVQLTANSKCSHKQPDSQEVLKVFSLDQPNPLRFQK